MSRIMSLFTVSFNLTSNASSHIISVMSCCTTSEHMKGGPLWLIDSQKALCAEIAEKIGFDFNK